MPGKDSKSSWIVRGYQIGDEQQTVPLFNTIFNKKMTEAEYLWKVVNSPWPTGTATTWVADSRGKIAGQYAATAMRFHLHETEHQIVHVCDVMTHPDFRRQGILSTIGETAHQNWAGNNVAFVTGFPHKGWGTRSHYLNWQTMYQGIWMWRLLDAGRMLPKSLQIMAGVTSLISKASNKFYDRRLQHLSQSISTRSISRVDEEFDTLWQKLKPHYPACVVRNAAWLRYRYLDSPHNEYYPIAAYDNRGELCGYVVCRLRNLDGKLVAYIADLFCLPEDEAALASLLKAAIQEMTNKGARALLSVIPERSFVTKHYHRAGFIKRYGSFDVSIVPFAEGLDYSALQDPQKWYSTGGDFDII
ncbi:MAG: GNAT family N-acetyltransferase [Calditrichia bacterium]